MSHQTGITASDDLKSFLATSRDSDCRCMKISIDNEKLVVDTADDADSTWENDYEAMVVNKLEEKMPCYILFRLDTKNNLGYEWIFISWSPDFSPVRPKMIYAATRSTMKFEFGTGRIKEEVFGTVPTDVTLSGYKNHLVSQDAPAPLTFAEEEMQSIKQSERGIHVFGGKTRSDISVDTKHQTMSGLQFPLTNEAIDRLIDLKEGGLTFVQLILNIAEEKVELSEAENIDVKHLSSKIPADTGRYTLFTYKHSHEGDYQESVVFIYSMPGYKCPIKERMLYSSCKGPLIDSLEGSLKLTIEKKLEIDDPNEITEAFLKDELHPQKNIARQAFSRPKGPGGRGPRRMMKANDGGDGN